MLHRALGWMATVGATGCLAATIAALQAIGSDRPSDPTWLWTAAVALLALAVLCGVGWLVTSSRDYEGGSVEAEADQGSVAQAAGRDAVIKDSNVVSGAVSAPGGTVHIGDVHTTPAKDGDPPTVTMMLVGRCVRVDVTNNDEREELIVETSGFWTNPDVKLRPRWNDDTKSQELKRGETGSLMIMCLEPARPNLGRTMPILAEYLLKPWSQRVQRGVRQVRFYSEDKLRDRTFEVPVNQSFAFKVSVLSDRHRPVVHELTYGVTENCRLVIPFDKDKIDEANALGTAEKEFLLAYLKSKEAEEKD